VAESALPANTIDGIRKHSEMHTDDNLIIAEPLGLATLENLGFALFCYMYKQIESFNIGHCENKIEKKWGKYASKSKYSGTFFNLFLA
jgi:hypothetical protein